MAATETDRRESQITEEVLASFDGTPDERLREIMRALVTHLHAFARETRLTEAEWKAGIDFLTRVGHITTDQRQDATALVGALPLLVGLPPGKAFFDLGLGLDKVTQELRLTSTAKGRYDWLNGGAWVGTLQGTKIDGKSAVRIRFYRAH